MSDTDRIVAAIERQTKALLLALDVLARAAATDGEASLAARRMSAIITYYASGEPY